MNKALPSYLPLSTPFRTHQDEGLFVVGLQPGGEVVQSPLYIPSPDHRQGPSSGEVLRAQVSCSL